MRREEIIFAANSLTEALISSDVSNILEVVTRQPELPQEGRSGVIRAMQKYMIAASSFDVATRRLVEELELEPLENPDFWTQVLGDGGDRRAMFELVQKVNFATTNLPNLVKLLKRDVIESAKAKDPQFRNQEVLSVLVIEEGESLSKPERLEKVLSAIGDLYDACAQLKKASPQSLSVVALDSGSDKSFDFLGLARVIEQVKAIILSMWDRIVFFREEKSSRRTELVAEALPVLQEIRQMRDREAIEPEKAEILERQVMEGATKFVDAGATIPEIDSQSKYNPRSLMTPEPKMLAGRNDGSREDERDDESEQPNPASNLPDSETLTEEQWTRLKQMLNEGEGESSSDDEDFPDEEQEHGE